jgi:drug/metabolite transporter (DMT)-like permease
MKENKHKIIAAFAAMYLIWGSTFLAIKYGVDTLPPFLLAAVRFLIAGAVFFAIGRSRSRQKLTRGFWRETLVLGVLTIVIANGFVTWAEKTVPSGLAAMMWALFPMLLVMVESVRRGGTRPGTRAITGTIIGLLGMALLLDPTRSVTGNVDRMGLFILVLAVLGWTAGTVYAKNANEVRPGLLSIGAQMLIASVVLAVISLARGEPGALELSDISMTSIAGLLYLVIVGSFAFPIYFWLLETTSPARVSTEAYVCPVIALVLGTVIAGEPFTVWTGVAAVIIVIGVAMLISDRGRRSHALRRVAVVPEAGNLRPGARALVENPRPRHL